MFELYANKNRLTVRKDELVTSGSVNVYEVRFGFSPKWEGLERTAVFRAGERTVSVKPDLSGRCVIPWEVLTTPGLRLEAGVYGTRGGDVVLPTVWASLGIIHTGTVPGENAEPPTPELWRQELERKGDGLGLEGLKLRLLSGDKPLSEVELPSPGGSGDHRELTGRDAEKQHPIRAIDGLEEEIRRIPAPVEPLTNEDLEEMLK